MLPVVVLSLVGIVPGLILGAILGGVGYWRTGSWGVGRDGHSASPAWAIGGWLGVYTSLMYVLPASHEGAHVRGS